MATKRVDYVLRFALIHILRTRQGRKNSWSSITVTRTSMISMLKENVLLYRNGCVETVLLLQLLASIAQKTKWL